MDTSAAVLAGFLARDYMRVAQVHFDYGFVPKVHNVETFAQALPGLWQRRGPAFISVRTDAEDGYMVRSSAGTQLDIQMHALRARLVGDAS